MYEQYHLISSIEFAMHKIEPNALTARSIRSNFNGEIERLAVIDNAFSFISSL